MITVVDWKLSCDDFDPDEVGLREHGRSCRTTPKELNGMRLRLFYRGSRLDAEITTDRLVLTAPQDWRGADRIGVFGTLHPFKAGDSLSIDLGDAGTAAG